MRDLCVFVATVAMLYFSLRNTFSAYLIWGWSGLIAINTFIYGFMVGLPYVLIFAIITLLLVVQRSDTEQHAFKLNRTIVLYIIFGIHCTLCATFAAPDLDRNWELCDNVLKTLLFCILMPMLATSRLRIHAMVIMIVLAVGFHGALDGLKFVLSGGAHNANGNQKMGDNNHFALTISMALPLLLYLYNYSKRKIVRVSFFSNLVLTTLAVVATRSRGGLLTMLVIALWSVMVARRKVTGLIVVGVMGVFIVSMAPASWTEKMDTINQAGEDTSFMGRVTAWKRASAIAVDNPVFGAGFHAGQALSLFPKYRYKPGILGFVDTPDTAYPAASHSIYFEVLGDMGFVGLLLLLVLLMNAFVTLHEIRKMVRMQGDSVLWAGDLADMLAAVLIGYMFGGALLSAAYFELSYIVMMLMEVVKQQLIRSKPVPIRARVAVG